jgi:cytidylate kinase
VSGSKRKPLGVPYLPAEFAKNLAEFQTMLKATPPTRAKRVDVGGGMVVTTATRRVYFRATENALRTLRHYGVEVDA